MSSTPAFRFRQPFPFCPEDIDAVFAGDPNYTSVGNLTLAEVMAFFWSLESFTISTVGSVTRSGLGTLSASCDVTLNPIGSTLRTNAAILSECEWFPSSAPTSPTAFASWPAMREPYERVCANTTDITGTMLALRWSDSISPDDLVGNSTFLRFYLGTDPSNSGKYRIYYRLVARYSMGTSPFAQMTFDNDSSVVGTAITSGTITIGGISLTWYSGYYGDSYSGGTMSATSASYTYV